MKNLKTILPVVAWSIQLTASAAAMLNIWRLNMIPDVYLWILGGLLLCLLVLTALLAFLPGKKGKTKALMIRQIIACVLILAITAGCVVAGSAAARIRRTISSITAPPITGGIVAVYVLDKNAATALTDLDNAVFGIVEDFDDPGTQRMIGEIEAILGHSITCKVFPSVPAMVEGLYLKEVPAIIMNSAYASVLEDTEVFEDFDQRVKILYESAENGPLENTEPSGTTAPPETTVPPETTLPPETTEPATEPTEEAQGSEPTEPSIPDVELTEGGITTKPFIVYISGSDLRTNYLTASRSDVNILMAVNPVTKQVLMINTPRDFYVPNPAGNGAMDKLTHCGVYGIECSVEALENFYNIEIDYYAQVNFVGFERLIDAVGGVTVYSDEAFVTRHGAYQIVQGYNEMNGNKALCFARERYALLAGDNARGKNQMKVLKAVIEKMETGVAIANYAEILESLQGMINTSLSADDLAQLVKMQLTDMAQWEIASYAVAGSGAYAETYSMPGYQLYVINPHEQKVNYAKTLLGMLKAGETLPDSVKK